MVALSLVIWLVSLLALQMNHASFKTGAAFSAVTSDINCDDLDTLSSVQWWFNYGINNEFKLHAHCNQTRTDIEYVPMKWGWGFSNLSSLPFPTNFTTILGFSKPNFKTYANLSPSAAVDAWKAIQNAFPDKILVSPAAAACTGSQAPQCLDEFGPQQAWLDEFFRVCNGTCRVDYIAVPLYWCYFLGVNKTVDDWIGVLRNIYNRYRIEIWLTEFNCVGGTLEQQKLFMREVIPVLESTPWIVRYAWVIARASAAGEASQLLTNDISESKLTELGELYNNLTLDIKTNATSANPTAQPTNHPTKYPSSQPTNPSTLNPTNIPTPNPTHPPTAFPSKYPTVKRPTIVIYPNQRSTQNPSVVTISSTDNRETEIMNSAPVLETDESASVDGFVLALVIIIVVIAVVIACVAYLFYDFKRKKDAQIQQIDEQNMIGMKSDADTICRDDHDLVQERADEDQPKVIQYAFSNANDEEVIDGNETVTKGEIQQDVVALEGDGDVCDVTKEDDDCEGNADADADVLAGMETLE